MLQLTTHIAECACGFSTPTKQTPRDTNTRDKSRKHHGPMKPHHQWNGTMFNQCCRTARHHLFSLTAPRLQSQGRPFQAQSHYLLRRHAIIVRPMPSYPAGSMIAFWCDIMFQLQRYHLLAVDHLGSWATISASEQSFFVTGQRIPLRTTDTQKPLT